MKVTLKLTSFVLAAAVLLSGCRVSDSMNIPGNSIIIQLELNSNSTSQFSNKGKSSNFSEIGVLPVYELGNSQKWQIKKGVVTSNLISWVLYSETPLTITSDFAKLKMVSPGDSINIRLEGVEAIISGTGSEKLNIWYQVKNIESKLAGPQEKSNKITTIDQYLEWNSYVDRKLTLQLALLESAKNKMQEFEYNHLKASIISLGESDRIHAFGSLVNRNIDNKGTFRFSDLNAIWDTTQHKPWKEWLASVDTYWGDIYALYAYNRLEIARNLDFNYDNDSLNKDELRVYLYYRNAKQNYKGLLRERLLVFIIDEPVITELRPTKSPFADTILNDYYRQPGFPEYKNYVKNLEKKAK